MPKKLLLIHPKRKSGDIGFADTQSLGLPPLALGYVAALTPDDWQVKIVDEYIDSIDFNEYFDLVGITGTTSVANRAYEIAGEFKKRNIPVVLGGIHATLCHEEAGSYVDAVVVGEAEPVWKELVKDVENHSLKKTYTGTRQPLDKLVIPRRDLFSDKYAMDVIQTTRGCPFDCEYCSATVFYGKKFRVRPVNEVLDELETIKKQIIYFTDDNLFGFGLNDDSRVIELCKGIIDRKIKKYWATQASLNIARYPKVLDYAYKSGCRGVYVGIESVSPKVLKGYNKTVNLELGVSGMKEAVKTIQRHGITVAGSFIFGSDEDNPGTFQKTLDFMNESGIDVVQVAIIAPFPGTSLFRRLTDEGRIFYNKYPEDWDMYDTDHLVFKLKNLKPTELVRGIDYITKNRFTRGKVLLQAAKTLFKTGNIVSALLAYNLNKDSILFFDYDRMFKKAGKYFD